MTLDETQLADMKNQVIAAYKHETRALNDYRAHARKLACNIHRIEPYSCDSISFVASDGGDNRIVFDPAVLELVRVCDSRGRELMLDAVSSNVTLDHIETRLKSGNPGLEPLRKLIRCVGASTLREVMRFIPDENEARKSTLIMQSYREIIEWAALYDLVADERKEWAGNVVYVRDGLLRSLKFKDGVFPLIDQGLRRGVERHKDKKIDIFITGVAKRSAVLSKLALAFEIENVFHCDYPCYVKVNRDIESLCYKEEKAWLDTYKDINSAEEKDLRYNSLGNLYLVKFGDKSYDPVWPVDIAWWQEHDVKRILGSLMNNAIDGFPIPNYPLCVQQAHKYARLGSIDMEFIQDMIVECLLDEVGEGKKESVLRFIHLGKHLIKDYGS